MEFRDAILKWFKWRCAPERDNLPVLVEGRHKARELVKDTGRPSLAKVMAEMGFTQGVEIGTAGGNSARMWCSLIPGLRLTCIDEYAPYFGRQSASRNDRIYEQAKAFLEECNAALPECNVTLLRSASLDIVNSFDPGSFDFVYIDANHTFDACMQDIIRWVPKVRVGGLVAIHDYYNFCNAGVVKAVDAYTHCHRIDPWFVTGGSEPTAFWQRGAELVP